MGKGRGKDNEPSPGERGSGSQLLKGPSEVLPLANVFIAGYGDNQIQIIMPEVREEWVSAVTVEETGRSIWVTWNPPTSGGPTSFLHTITLGFVLPDGWVSYHQGLVLPESDGCFLGYYDAEDRHGGYLINLPRDEAAECPNSGDPDFQAVTPCAWCYGT